MRTIHRVGACILVLLVTTISYIHIQQIPLPDYLPQTAHNYFHHADKAANDQSPQTTFVNPHGQPPLKSIESVLNSPVLDGGAAALDTRLQAFLIRPIPTFNESIEINSHTCPTHGVNFDRGTIKDSHDSWSLISNSQILQWRRNIVSYLENFFMTQDPSSVGKRQDRGIVFAAGDTAAIRRVTTNINILHANGCKLPIQIFHYQSELSSADFASLKALSTATGLNITTHVIRNMERGVNWKSFQIKPLAIAQSTFTELIWLDTDSLTLRDPTTLFESEEYKETGLLLWPDFTKSHASNPLWRLLGQTCRDEYEGESGQLLINRGRHEDLVALIEYFAMEHNTYFAFMGGDRDSFRAAALILGKQWRGPGRALAAAGVVYPDDVKGGGHTMLQADPSGRWMFVHANLIKHTTFPQPYWTRIHRFKEDYYVNQTTYGVVEGNEGLGTGVCIDVLQNGGLKTRMFPFEGFPEDLVVEEEWNTYDELKGFEEKWTKAGGGLG